MKSDLVNCKRERELGIELARALGAGNTANAFADYNQGPEHIVKAAIDELMKSKGLEIIVENALKGPARWAASILRFVPDVGASRASLLEKVAEDPSAAYDVLQEVSDLGDHREALMQAVAKDPGFAHMAALNVTDADSHREMLLAAAVNPPAEYGGGYNTYFVNQTGRALWVRWNTGMRGSTGSLSTPVFLQKGQNAGWGRGGACISEMIVFDSLQHADTWGSPIGITGALGSWRYTRIDGCLSWGFVLTPEAGGGVKVAAEAWAEGQPGLPGQYPPSYGG